MAHDGTGASVVERRFGMCTLELGCSGNGPGAALHHGSRHCLAELVVQELLICLFMM